MIAYFLIHGVSLSLESNDQAFLAFAKQYLRGFEQTQPEEIPLIAVKHDFIPGFTFRFPKQKKGDRTLGSGIEWNESEQTLDLLQREFRTRVSFKDTWNAEVLFQKNFFKHLANKLFFAKQKTQTNYYRATLRSVAQQLVFMQLATKGISTISAAASSVNQQAVIAVGLPGSGKSTLMNAVREQLQGVVLTENFVLTDGHLIYPFPEGNNASTRPIPIKHVLLLSHGNHFINTTLSSEDAAESIRIVNQLTAELPEHSAFHVLSIINPLKWNSAFSTYAIDTLCGEHPCSSVVADLTLANTLKIFE